MFTKLDSDRAAAQKSTGPRRARTIERQRIQYDPDVAPAVAHVDPSQNRHAALHLRQAAEKLVALLGAQDERACVKCG
ncbi:MAG TPA: hypothetical protein VHW23_34255 [Kofleriaceae bacterium]|nr:hypothetical protein [Kofleriaceae bacterium]